MRSIKEILVVLLIAAALFAQEGSSGDPPKKKTEVVRDESSGSVTVGARSTEALSAAPQAESAENSGESFDLGGFLKELFEAERPKKAEAKADYKDRQAPKQAPSPVKPALRAAEVPKTKANDFDTFRDDNDNGIDDRLEGAKTIEPSRSKK